MNDHMRCVGRDVFDAIMYTSADRRLRQRRGTTSTDHALLFRRRRYDDTAFRPI
jgi:hypothetical protein